jgi:predicted aldo/keto reductase-like oxidoreductase
MDEIQGKNKRLRAKISRRHFMRGVAVTAAAGTLGLTGFDCIKLRNRIKYVTLGRTGMKVSQFLGDRMDDRKMYELAIAAGINYWHKYGHWEEPAPYDLFRKLDRDSFYCDTIIDSLDKDESVEIFEGVLKKTGLEMIDGFKIHSQYKNTEEVRTKMGAVQAFEQLKKQGKTRFLMMSQHINTSEVFEAAVESELFDLIQVPVNPTVPRDYFTQEVFKQKAAQDEYLGLVKKAADKGIAMTAMKVFLYGKKYWDDIPDLRERVKEFLPDNKSIATALIHWALNVPGVSAYGSMLYSFEELQENLEAIGGKLTDEEDKGLKKLASAMGSSVCRMCGACQRANPGGAAVSDIMRLMGYCIGFGQYEQARKRYAA